MTMNADGSNAVPLTNSQWATYDPFAWSPDGAKIAFYGDGPDPQVPGPGLYTINRDGTDLTLLSVGNLNPINSPPAWSPDGTKIVFVRNPNPVGEIYAIELPHK